jgi:16S rRNA (cytosine967-C5)-methyltransferase
LEENLDFAVDKRSDFGYYVTHNTLQKLNLNDKKLFFVQNEGSVMVCEVVRELSARNGLAPGSILDVCAAPGGKAVLMSEIFPDTHVRACDIHSHRAELIAGYARSAGADNVAVSLRDGTIVREGERDAYDIVLCDAPCSGFGVLSSRADIRLKRTSADVDSLAALQYRLLVASSECVASGGLLVYSTCTLFSEENAAVADRFLAESDGFYKLQINLPIEYSDICGYAQLLPDIGGTDAFFIAAFGRVNT